MITLKFLITTCFSLYTLFYLSFPLAVNSAELKLYSDETVPNFLLPDLVDESHSLQDYKGKVVLVNFWASWCPPCIYEMPELTRLKTQMAGKAFEILAINVGEKKYRVKKFVKLINFNLPVLLDTRNDTFNNWGVKTLPTSFLVDGTGHIRYRIRGNPGWESDETTGIINKLLDEETHPE
jgi:thiol-disulfide isomerase/thioredoxin